MSLTRESLLTLQSVGARIVALGASAKVVQEEIHLIGCSTLDHIRAHGDTTGAVALMNALPKGQRVKALGAWFKHFSSGKVSMQFDKKAGAWKCNLGKDRTDDMFKIDEAMEITFADLTEERDPVTLTLEKFLKGIERTANNAEMFDGTEIPKVEPAAREYAAKLVAYARTLKAAA